MIYILLRLKLPLILILNFAFLFSCKEENPKKIDLQGKAFGTTYAIQLFGFEDRPYLQHGIDSIIHAVNASMSIYMAESDISRINLGDSSVIVDDMFQEVFRLSKEVHENTQGYFDPTIGSLRNAYGFGEVDAIPNFSSSQLDSLMEYVGFEKVSLSAAGRIIKQHPQIYLDFNAIAKGYAVDKLAEFLESNGVQNFLVEIGGEIRAKGKNILRQADWTVGLEKPEQNKREVYSKYVVRLENRAIAGSGNYRNFLVDSIDHQKLVHTINPITGKSEPNDMLAAYVLAANCAEADAYATDFMAAGFEESKELLNTLGHLEAYLIYLDSLGRTNTHITDGFHRFLVKN